MKNYDEMTNRQSIKSDVSESIKADQVSENSRDDVYKRLGGEFVGWIITGLSLILLVGLIYYHGVLTGEIKLPVFIERIQTRTNREVLIIAEDPNTREVTIVYPRTLPATGSTGSNTLEE